MGGRRCEGGQAVGCACVSLRLGGRKIRHRKARGDAEPFMAKPLDPRPRKASREIKLDPYPKLTQVGGVSNLRRSR